MRHRRASGYGLPIQALKKPGSLFRTRRSRACSTPRIRLDAGRHGVSTLFHECAELDFRDSQVRVSPHPRPPAISLFPAGATVHVPLSKIA